MVDNCRRIAASQFLARFGPPVSDGSAGAYACRFGKSSRLVIRSSAQKLSGVRWWFVCPTCDERCGFLYSPRSLEIPELLPRVLATELSVAVRLTEAGLSVTSADALNDLQFISEAEIILRTVTRALAGRRLSPS